MNTKELFNTVRDCEILDVMNVHGSACDNAAATIEDQGGKFIQGEFTDEFITYWLLSVESLLSSPDSSTIEAREWFDSIGFTY